MRQVYLNHAGTTWPKPTSVVDACAHALQATLSELDQEFDDCLTHIASFIGIKNPQRLLLTPGCTSSLALALGDIQLEPDDAILSSSFEHHAMHRPLIKLAEAGTELKIIPPSIDAPIDLDILRNELKTRQVKWVALSAASNVTGDLLPISQIVQLAHEQGAKVLVDAAQTVGWIDYDIQSLGVDMFAFGGHKGLLGPWGIGGLYVAEEVDMNTPQATCAIPSERAQGNSCGAMPGYCDGGSVDRVALAGLNAALNWLDEHPDRLATARKMCEQIRDAVADIPAVLIYGQAQAEKRTPTVAFNIAGRSSAEVASALKSRGIIVASGLQCAPMAHEVLGTTPDGAVRISVGAVTTWEEVSIAVEAIKEL